MTLFRYGVMGIDRKRVKRHNNITTQRHNIIPLSVSPFQNPIQP
jgi:hypothetical protein